MNENVDSLMIRLVGLALAVLMMAGMTIYTGLFPKASAMAAGVRLFCGKERALLCGSSIKISDCFFTSCVNGGETCVNEDCRGGGNMV